MDIDVKSLAEAIGQGVGEALAKNGGMSQKHDASTTQTTNYMHGPNGIFGVLGSDRDVFSTRIRPSGLLSVLPAFGVNDMSPLVPYLTGITDYEGDDPDAPCDDPPTAGDIKNCYLTAVFGRVTGETEAIEATRVGQIINRGEFTDLRVVNDPIVEQNVFLPGTAPTAATRALNQEILARLLTLGVYFEQRLSGMVYTGNPANNSANNGYMEFPGLDMLISTGKVDAITGGTCPALDSDIKDFNYGHVDGNDPNILRYLTYMWRIVNHIASKTNLRPVTWALVMRETLFYELTATWPCNYLTYRCVDFNLDANVSLNISGDEQVRMRDKMREGKYLLIDGVKVPVITDDAIAEECGDEGEACFNANLEDGQFASDIYLVPLTVQGGRQVTFFQFFNYSGPNAIMATDMFGKLLDGEFWTDDGKFIWYRNRTRTCLEWGAVIQPRLRVLTPHLAGRLQNVRYSPLQHTRDAFPDDPYFTDGGEYSRSTSSYYSEWNPAA